ncbi:MAG: hypothetical protein HW378_184 [Anaerolineales bacterium]|nr:hypothetical protein [Anaerolineales bacterium]
MQNSKGKRTWGRSGLALACLLLNWLPLDSELAAQPVLPQINVRQFGARGDGVTDDTAAIQAAFNSSTNNRAVYFPAGRYRLSGGGAALLTITNRVSIFTAGPFQTQLLVDATVPVATDVILLDATGDFSNQTWEGLSIVAASGAPARYGLVMQTQNGDQIRECVFQNMHIGAFGSGSLFVNPTANYSATEQFHNVYFNNRFDGLVICTNIADSTLWHANTFFGPVDYNQLGGAANTEFANNTFLAAQTQLKLRTYSDRIWIHNNYFEFLGTATGKPVCLELDGAFSEPIRDVRITENQFSFYDFTNAIYLNHTTNAVIEGNVFYGRSTNTATTAAIFASVNSKATRIGWNHSSEVNQATLYRNENLTTLETKWEPELTPRNLRGLQFDGTASSYVTATVSAFTTNDFTAGIRFLCPLNNSGTKGLLLLSTSATGPAASAFLVYLSGASLRVLLYGNPTDNNLTRNIPSFVDAFAGRDVSLLVARATNGLTLFINGIRFDGGTDTLAGTMANRWGEPLAGTSASVGIFQTNSTWAGKIHSALVVTNIWPNTEARLRELSLGNVKNYRADAVFAWDLSEDVNRLAVDVSGNGRDGTFQGGVTNYAAFRNITEHESTHEVSMTHLKADTGVLTNDFSVSGIVRFTDPLVSGQVYLGSPVGTTEDLIFQNTAVGVATNRWIVRKVNTAETGSNAGSDFYIIALDDAGTTSTSVLALDRSTFHASLLSGGLHIGASSDPGPTNLWVNGKIYFGTTADVELVRAAANTLQTGSNEEFQSGALKVGTGFTEFQISTAGNASWNTPTAWGLRLNNLTTVQRDALVGPPAGANIWNTTLGTGQKWNGAAWVSDGGLAVAGTDNRIVRMDGTSAIQDSLASVDDVGTFSAPALSSTGAGGGVVDIYEPTQTFYSRFAFPAGTANRTLNWPDSAGSSGQSIITDGTGNLSYATRASGAGTANTMAKWTGASTLGDSGITDTGSQITMVSPVDMQHANGVTIRGPALVESGRATNNWRSATATVDTSAVIPQINDANGNEEVIFTATASAVNELTIANAATGTTPTISATGGDANIGIKLMAKGAANLDFYGGTSGVIRNILGGTAVLYCYNNNVSVLNVPLYINASDTALSRESVGILQFGLDATTPVAVSFKVGDATGIDKAAAATATMYAPLATGGGTDGAFVIRTGTGAQATSSTLHSTTPRVWIDGDPVTLTETVATTVATITLAAAKYVGGDVVITVFATDGTDHQSTTTHLTFDAVNKAGVLTVGVPVTQTQSTAPSTGTLTALVTATSSGANLLIQVNATSSLTQTTLQAMVHPRLNSNNTALAVTIP